MTTCKDCLHIDACKQWYPPLPDKYHDGCEHFINKLERESIVPAHWVILGQRVYGSGSGRNYTHYCSRCGNHGYDDDKWCSRCRAYMDLEE